ncbi:MAG: response regulator [Acidobacteriia bacterium]|nr:response regulator [Terriglobia bacterium]
MPAKRLLKNNDRKFRLLFAENPQPMWVSDPQSQKFLETNAAASALYGYSQDEFRSMTLADVQSVEECLRFTEELRGPARPTASTWRHRTKSGRMIDVEIAIHQIDYGGIRAELAVLMDITGRRHLEDQLRQAQRMEAVGMLAGGIAHDFNNLLTIISGYSQLILVSLNPNDPNRHSAEQIMKAGESAAALTRQLLAFSRRQGVQPRVLELNKLVGSLSAMLQRLIGEDVELRLVLPPDLGRVSADPGQIEQVLMNLLVNSRDAMAHGGILTIETANVHLDESYAGRHIAVKPGPYVLLAVSDTGCGMDEATKAHLFEPFFTTKGAGRGTGLGLSTVFGIVKQSGGSVDVYSEPGRGTSVKVYLPRIDQPVLIEAERGKKTFARGTETILLVEDDEMVRTLVRETLEREGYKVIDSADPVAARHISENYKGSIHLLITDVVMPKIGGRELANQLIRRRPGMRVLYMSGYTDNAVLNSGILQKEVAFLQKPFTPAGLTEKVREVLEGDGKILSAGE